MYAIVFCAIEYCSLVCKGKRKKKKKKKKKKRKKEKKKREKEAGALNAGLSVVSLLAIHSLNHLVS